MPFNISTPVLRRRLLLSAAVCLILLAALFGGRPIPPAAANGCSVDTDVATETELNSAIAAYNALNEACIVTITFTNDIVLTAGTEPVNKKILSMQLNIDGGGFRLDGNHVAATVTINAAEWVMIKDLTIANSNGHGITLADGLLLLRNVAVLDSFLDGLFVSNNGDADISGSTIARNRQNGIKAVHPAAGLTLSNSTIAANGQTGLLMEQRNIDLVHVTVAGNKLGVITIGDFNRALILNSIVAGNTEEDCGYGGGTPDVRNSLVGSDPGSSVCGLVDGANGNLIGHDPLLLPLGDYGGATLTMPPAQYSGSVTAASPVIDAGDHSFSYSAYGFLLIADQRGYPRDAVNGPVDMGAVEGTVAVACPAFPANADSEATLDTAIGCFNAATTPGVYRVDLTDDIDLTLPARFITNPTPGAELVVFGHGNSLSGQHTPGYRPLTIGSGATATLNYIYITGGNVTRGGGIHNRGDLTLNDVGVINNIATGGGVGGGIYNEAGATLNVAGGHASDNVSEARGGGVYNRGVATLTDFTASVNKVNGGDSSRGGGIHNAGTMTVVRGTIDYNVILAIGFFSGPMGGGISNEADLTIRDSVIHHNSVNAVYYYAAGGGVSSIMSVEAVNDRGHEPRMLIINTTISANTLYGMSGAGGAGVYVFEANSLLLDTPPEIRLTNTTVFANTADSLNSQYLGPLGAYFAGSDSGAPTQVTLHNSILAGNGLSDCNMEDVAFESRHSLYESSGAGACGLAAGSPAANGNYVGVSHGLGALDVSGGGTLTHMPLPGSLAINNGDNALAVDENGDPLAADQRGYGPRAAGGTVDIGAHETEAEPSPIFMSVKANVTIGGVKYDNSDILKWNGAQWAPWFDGGDALLSPKKSKHNVNAFWIPDPSGEDVVMAFSQNARKVGQLSDKVEGNDLVWWDGNDWSLWFDGSDVGLEKKGPEKIDGLHVLPGSASPIGGACAHYLLISTQGVGAVPIAPKTVLKFGGEDILGFCMTNVGADTAGFWHIAFDGSAAGLPKNSLDSISVAGNTIYFTTNKKITVNGAAYAPSMVHAYSLSREAFSGPLFVPAENELGKPVDGLQAPRGLN